jgi:hypothetical protein
MSTSTGILKVDWDLLGGVVLVFFLLVVGYVLHNAEPVWMPAADQAKIARYRAAAEGGAPSGESANGLLCNISRWPLST